MTETPPHGERRKRRPLLEVDRISKLFAMPSGWFGKQRFVRVVDNASYFVRHGETLGLVGRTGAGKTMLAHATLRLTEPSYGRIKFDGHELTQLSQSALRPLRRDLQIVFQDPRSSLDPRLSVRDIVADPIRIHRTLTSEAEIRDRVGDLGRRLGLDARDLDRRPPELSAGQAQKVALARALATEPRMLVLDDALAHQDPRSRSHILAHLSESQEEHRSSILLVGHDLRVVASLSHRVAVMYFGRIIEVGPTAALMHDAQHPYTRALIGAMPEFEPERRRLRVVLEGDRPNPFSPPTGCSFHMRCPRAKRGQCDREIPDLAHREGDPAHRVACFHPGAS